MPLQIGPFTQEIVARQGTQGCISVQPGNYVQNQFADGYDLIAPSNALQIAWGQNLPEMLLGDSA